MRLFDSVKSMYTAMRASAALGHGFKARDQGDLRSALTHARHGLALLRQPYVRRGNPAEGSALVSLTLLAEEAGRSLGEQGMTQDDLADSILFLKRLEGENQPDLCSYLPYLEARYGEIMSHAAS